MATYQVHVDWDRNANYTGTYDDISAYVRSINSSIGFKAPYANVAGEQTLSVELDNSDRRFSPEYSGSPLYGKRFRNRPIRFQIVSGSTTVLWTGKTDMITPQTNINGERRAILTATGFKRILDGMQVSIPLQVGKRTDEILAVILANTVIPEVLSVGPWALGIVGYGELGTNTVVGSGVIAQSLETGTLTPAYAGDTWDDNISPYEAIKQVVEAERGKFFFDRSSTAVFWNRNHMLADSTSLATYTDSTIISYDYNYGSDIQNYVTVSYYPRVAGSGTEILWSLDKPVDLTLGVEKKIRARFTEQGSNSKVSATTVIRPLVDDGAIVFSFGTADVVGWSYDAKGAELIFLARTTDATISSIIISGTKLTSYNKADAVARSAESEFYDDRSDVVYDLKLLDDEADAQAIADYEVGRRASATGTLKSVTLMNKNAASLAAIIARTIGHRITISEQQTGHSADYFIIGEQHSVSEAGTKHVCTWYLEPAASSAYWLLGTTGRSALGTTTKVAP